MSPGERRFSGVSGAGSTPVAVDRIPVPAASILTASSKSFIRTYFGAEFVDVITDFNPRPNTDLL